MRQPHSSQSANSIMHRNTGVVIPVYVPEGIDTDHAETLLRDTVTLFCDHVDDHAAICLSVDGVQHGEDIARNIAGNYGVSLCVSQVNRGKLHAVTQGMQCLLEDSNPSYIAVVDQDGDHFGNELLNFVRMAEHISGQTGTARMFILGRRISRHRPMGFLRGEIEELADRVLLDALHYHASVTGNPLRLEYAGMLDEFPDFHSGYKLFSASVAADMCSAEPKRCGVSEECYYRHAVEAVLSVEALQHGAIMGVVNRTTFNEQPITTFGMLNRIQLAADKIIWPCKRLDIPLPFIKQWLANHLPRLLLNTLAPEGKVELDEIRKRVLAVFGEESTGDSLTASEPLFV